MKVDSPDGAGDFTRLLLAVARTMMNDSATLVAGRAPDGWPAAMTPPPPVETLGGFTVGHGITSVFVYPETSSQPFAEYMAFLEGAGWRLQDEPVSSGFVSSRHALLDNESATAMLRLASDDPGERILAVSLMPPKPSPSNMLRMHREMLRVPRLLAPPGVVSEGSGSGSGGGGGTLGNAYMVHRGHALTHLSPAELLPLYATQLIDAGWKAGSVFTANDTAMQQFEASDVRRRTWRGHLVVYLHEPVRELYIYMTTMGYRADLPDGHPMRARRALGGTQDPAG